MSNFGRAVKALNDVDEAIDHLADNEAYVTALQAAGLLMPDLPEPDRYDEHGWPVYGETGYITHFSMHPSYEVPYISTSFSQWVGAFGAREEAYRLLAAAQWLDEWDKEHAEKEQGNE